jgi:hypothetical protein
MGLKDITRPSALRQPATGRTSSPARNFSSSRFGTLVDAVPVDEEPTWSCSQTGSNTIQQGPAGGGLHIIAKKKTDQEELNSQRPGLNLLAGRNTIGVESVSGARRPGKGEGHPPGWRWWSRTLKAAAPAYASATEANSVGASAGSTNQLI